MFEMYRARPFTLGNGWEAERRSGVLLYASIGDQILSIHQSVCVCVGACVRVCVRPCMVSFWLMSSRCLCRRNEDKSKREESDCGRFECSGFECKDNAV